MARKKVIDLDAHSTVKFEKTGQTFEGYYLGKKTVNGEMGPSSLHVFQAEKENVGVWGSSKLDEKLGSVPVGSMTFITYGGKQKISGGRTMKKFEVEYDDADSINVDNIAVNFATKANDEEEEAEEENEELETSEEEAEEEQEEEEEEEAEEEEEETERNPIQSKPKHKATPGNKSKAAEVSSLLSKKKR